MSAQQFILIFAPLTALIPTLLAYQSEQGLKRQTLKTLSFIIMWMSAVILLAHFDIFKNFDRFPPPIMILFPTMITISLVSALSSHGQHIIQQVSVYTLIGLQSFRIIPEVFLAMAYTEGLAPIQMTIHGQNMDVITALVALSLFVLRNKIKISEKIVGYIFSILGLGLLMNIFIVAVLSMPTPIRYFLNEPANTFVASSPYIWLITVWVFIAIWLHILLILKLRASR